MGSTVHAVLAEWVQDSRRRLLALVADLPDEQLLGPRLATINPLIWEIGHVAWFQEKWVLRAGGARPSIRSNADALYDSAAVPHDIRWSLPLLSRKGTQDYMTEVCDLVLKKLADGPSDEEFYFTKLAVFHEDMHGEALTYMRQTLGYPAPTLQDVASARLRLAAKRIRNDVQIPGGTFMLGASPHEPFVFDNEKWAHPVEVKPFALARTAVTQAEFAAFVEEDAYLQRKFWSGAGWNWRQGEKAEHPVYWRRASAGGWERRHFDQWLPLETDLPVSHVNWYEADAYCRWAGRRLPTEAEWEFAASAGQTNHKRRFPWGDQAPTRSQGNLDGWSLGCVSVDDLPAGDSALGCRQMIGNVWEWTASDFLPYPGFVADPYKEYSQPWFGTHKVLRGGCWATRSRLIRNTWRNFYTPDRRDVFAGFRTCR